MRLSEIVSEGAVVTALESQDSDSVVNELVGTLVAAGAAEASLQQELVQKVLERESIGSTGFGNGVAVPHVKHPAITKMTGAIGLSEAGVEFNALDRQPVYSFFLLLSPPEPPEVHLRAMEAIFKQLGVETFRRFLRQARTVEDVMQLLEDADNQSFVA